MTASHLGNRSLLNHRKAIKSLRPDVHLVVSALSLQLFAVRFFLILYLFLCALFCRVFIFDVLASVILLFYQQTGSIVFILQRCFVPGHSTSRRTMLPTITNQSCTVI